MTLSVQDRLEWTFGDVCLSDCVCLLSDSVSDLQRLGRAPETRKSTERRYSTTEIEHGQHAAGKVQAAGMSIGLFSGFSLCWPNLFFLAARQRIDLKRVDAQLLQGRPSVSPSKSNFTLVCLLLRLSFEIN